ncbi:tyrosine-type recombinase/integrase [Ureibacillus thermophilus]|uniref:tyrosine-type recombinase/integrase n=1 Tax=Ureibacillus thermophilus TaxID=367743 RepID=UPI003614C253
MLLDQVKELFLKSLEQKNYSDETIRGYDSNLKDFNAFLTQRYNTSVYIDEITVEDIEAYLQHLAEIRKLQPKSRNRYLSSISSMLTFAVKKEWINKNPAMLVDNAKVIDKPKVSLTGAEIMELANAVDSPIIKTAILFMSTSGLRVNETLNLKISDLDLTNNIINVVGKGGKYRPVPISQSLKPILLDYLEEIRNAESEYLFATEKTGRLSAQYINRELQLAVKKLGWEKKVSNHTLRRSFATNLYQKGVSLLAIQKLLGHESLRTTSIYLNVQQSELHEAVNVLKLENKED